MPETLTEAPFRTLAGALIVTLTLAFFEAPPTGATTVKELMPLSDWPPRLAYTSSVQSPGGVSSLKKVLPR